MKHTFGEYTVSLEKGSVVVVKDHEHSYPEYELFRLMLAEVESLKLKLEQAHDEADEQRFVLTAAHNHLFEMLLSGGGGVYDQARSYLKRHQPDLEARLETVKPPEYDDDNDDDMHQLASQMIGFCEGFASPEDIADIRKGLMLSCMKQSEADRVLWAMRNVRKDK